MKRKGDWIITYTGRRFYPFDPHPEDIFIEDIAHALSNLCRFTGHTKHFYSVAQHSCLVSQQLSTHPWSLKLQGLLHDASEAYFNDMSRPVKRSIPKNNIIRKADAKLQHMIFRRFGILEREIEPNHPIIKIADNDLLFTEGRDLITGGTIDWHDAYGTNVLSEITAPWVPEIAEATFLELYTRLRVC